MYLHREMKRLGITILDRVMATSLLSEGGKAGARVVGATGLNVRTGEFYVLRAKATVLTTGQPLRIWVFNTELAGLACGPRRPQLRRRRLCHRLEGGRGVHAHGAKHAVLRPLPLPGLWDGQRLQHLVRLHHCGRERQRDPLRRLRRQTLKTVAERFHPKPGKGQARLIPDLAERIRSGEFALPFYADLPRMPEHERRAIFGLMVCHEGKTRIPIYKTYTEAGFDPDQDMLQANLHSPEVMGGDPVWWDVKTPGASAPQWRETAFGGGGGLVVDWDMRTNLEGLYAAGNQLAGYLGHVSAAATGRYAGRKVAEYARHRSGRDRRPGSSREGEGAGLPAGDTQLRGIGWKELQAGVCRSHAGLLRARQERAGARPGSRMADRSIRESEAARAYARNPHELWRTLEVMVRMTVGEMIMHASLARRASSRGPRLLASRLPGYGSARVEEVRHHSPRGRGSANG